MDKVAVSDESNQYTQIDLIGPRAAEVLTTLSISAPSRVGGVIQTTVQGISLTVLGLGEWSLYPAYRLCVSSAEEYSLARLLKDHGVIQIGSQTHDVLRIEAGIPGRARELTPEYTPLEVRLEHAISDTKGCYTGQEVIARQISYDKVVRHLVGVKLSNQVEVGTELRAEGRPVGVLTSVGESPRFGHIALAIVRRTHAAVGTSVEVSDTRKSTAVIRDLPFTE
jgi:folate-binding protein YgfZ